MDSELTRLRQLLDLEPKNKELIYQYRSLLIAIGRPRQAGFLREDKVLVDDNPRDGSSIWMPEYTWVGLIYPSERNEIVWTIDSWKNFNDTDTLWIGDNHDYVMARSVKEVTLIEASQNFEV